MASSLFDKGREGFLDGSINYSSDTIKAALVNTSTYTVNLATHTYYSDLSGVVGTPAALASKTVTAGVADAADVTYTAVTGSAVGAIVVYKDTGTTTTSRLIAYIDGVSVTPNGGDITITWDNGSNKIFRL